MSAVDEPVWLTVRQAALLAGVDTSTIRRWSDEGRVHQHRSAGGHRSIERSSLLSTVRRTKRPLVLPPLVALDLLAADVDRWRGWRPTDETSSELREMLAVLRGHDGGGIVAVVDDLVATLTAELEGRDQHDDGRAASG